MNEVANDDEHLSFRDRLHEVIFEADTRAGKTFDVLLILAIIISVMAVLLESVDSIEQKYGPLLKVIEWFLTVVFTIEYGLRLYCVANSLRYAKSFFGLVDLLSILPTWISFFLPGSESLLVIRALRLLRVARVLKLPRFVGEANILLAAVRSSLRKILIFVGTVSLGVLVMGTAMYLIEGGQGGFTSIPNAMYWAVVTMTTVGYGDIVPHSALGKIVAATTMMIGYGIIAVPTGIVTAEIVHASREAMSTRHCPHCSREGHALGARYCLECGGELIVPSSDDE